MKEKKGLGEIGRREERRMGRIVKGIVMMVVMMVMGCNSGGVSEGKVNLEAKNSFLESLVKIGEGFQEIFVGFGSAIGDALGFSVVKSGDKRSKVGEHFKKIGDGLTTTKNKLNELKVKISEAKNADGNTIKVVEDAIKGASDVFEQLIGALTKLSDSSRESNTLLADNAAGAIGADKVSVETVIESIKTIVEVAEKSDVKVEKGIAGDQIVAGNANTAPAVLTHNAAATANSGPKLADEISKADPWAMIDKIRNAKTVSGALSGNDNGAGALATGGNVANGAGAKSNADLAAAVALKSMTKSGKFSAANGEEGAVKAAAAGAVNKVLGVLDLIIKRTVGSNLEKVKEAVKGIKYSETSGVNSAKSDTIQATTTK
ncbi:Variable major protein (plasmid) [Borrelia crocidurae DOU]|uniref:Variable large protein n=1 Tax=Borrelia crocidurae DOU TaxID=1293575 RepID=W5SKV6_9SPIR|nr:variable large family protein [Borrelia crocidurae]AHH07288.1 Variable major protein [Borrelia crocidurae DOU]